MKKNTLFLAVAPSPLEPSFGEFKREMTDLPLRVFDPEAETGPQFENIGTVVDLGGWARAEHLDAGIDAGVDLWQVFGYGLEHLDVNRLLVHGVQVAHTPGSCTAQALAEHAMLLTLACTRHLGEQQRNFKEGRFYEPWTTELGEKILLIVGLGASGRALARLARAFGMEVMAVEQVPPADAELRDLGITRVSNPSELRELSALADVISLHLPLTKSTHHIIDAAAIGSFKKEAILVNVARGPLVDEGALLEALDEGLIGGAGLDVFEMEPPAERVWGHPRVVSTPHTAGATRETARRRAASAVTNILRVDQGLKPLDYVTLEDGFIAG